MRSNKTDNETQYEAQAGNKDGVHGQPGVIPVLEKGIGILKEKLNQTGLAHEWDDGIPKGDFEVDVKVFEAHGFIVMW
jgi:hypothetical protein